MDTSNKKNCAIIIATYNGAKWIEACIASCQQSAYPVHIIVVDNHSQDNTLALLPKKEITLLPLNCNIGFGRANNLGMSVALKNLGVDYVFLLNQDAYIEKDTISKLVACHQQYPHLSLISPLHYGGEGKAFDYRFKIYYKRSLSHKRNRVDEAGIQYCNFVNAAAWFLPKESILQNGGFDPIFFHTGEDDNYCSRLLARGKHIAITNSCFIRHDRQNRDLPPPPPYLRIATRSKIILFNPMMNPLRKIGELFLLTLKFLANLLLPAYRTPKKLLQNYKDLKKMLDYKFKYRAVYAKDGAFLEDDYKNDNYLKIED